MAEMYFSAVVYICDFVLLWKFENFECTSWLQCFIKFSIGNNVFEPLSSFFEQI